MSMIQNTRKWHSIAAQYWAIVSRQKDAKLYIAKGRLNVDNTNGCSQDGIQQRVSKIWSAGRILACLAFLSSLSMSACSWAHRRAGMSAGVYASVQVVGVHAGG